MYILLRKQNLNVPIWRDSNSYTDHIISVDGQVEEEERKIECEFCNEHFDNNDEHYMEHLKTHLVEWKEKSTRLKRPRGYKTANYFQ